MSRLNRLVASLTLLTLLTATAPAVADENPELTATANQLVAMPAEDFAHAEHVPPFDWSTDGCSVPGHMAPYSKLFAPACALHDFGYRNFGTHAEHALGLDPTRARKEQVDVRFLTEMRRICDQQRPGPIRHAACYGAARAYYDAVRLAGDSSFYAPALRR